MARTRRRRTRQPPGRGAVGARGERRRPGARAPHRRAPRVGGDERPARWRRRLGGTRVRRRPALDGTGTRGRDRRRRLPGELSRRPRSHHPAGVSCPRRRERRGIHLACARRVRRVDESVRLGLVIVHCALSYYAVARDDFTTARAEAEVARDLARQIDNPSATSSALLNLARSIEHEDPAGALDAYEQSIAFGRTGAMTLMVGPALVGVARLRLRVRDSAGALDALHDGITHSIYVGYRPVVVEVLGASASI